MSMNPFPGPQPYRAADRGRFYGRDALIKKLANQVLARAATTVFGPSGAGKSSLLQAGVIPTLEDSDDIRLVRVDAWPAGEAPLPWLVNAVATELELGSPRQTVIALEALQDTIDRAGRQSDRPVLVYLDQFEQIFIAGHDERALKELLDGLTWLIRRKQNRELHLILSLREDYLGRLRDWTREKPELTAHGFRVGPLTVGEMVKAMCQTAADGDPPQMWNPDEISSLMLDVQVPGQKRGEGAEVQAAFAQIVCRAVWEDRAAGKTMDMRRANAEVILQNYLDTTLAELGTLRESALKLLELQLIDDEGHRTLLTEKEARLVVPGADAIAVLTHLEKSAILHAEEHQGSRYFELGHDWLAKKVFERRKERKQREEIEAKDVQMRAERARFRQRMAVGTVITLTALGLAGWAIVERLAANREKENANQQTEEARRQRDAAMVAEKKAEQASRMAVTRELMLTGKPDLAALVLQTIDDPQSARGWTQAAIDALKERLPKITLQFARDEHPLAWSHDGTRVLTTVAGGSLRIVYADRQTPSINFALAGYNCSHAYWSPDDRHIVATTDESTLLVWRADGSEKPVIVGQNNQPGGHVAWSPDGKRIAATALNDNKVRIWQADSSDKPIVQEYPGRGWKVGWNPSGTQIKLHSGLLPVLGAVILPSMTTNDPVGKMAQTVYDIEWSADGLKFASVGTERGVLPQSDNQTFVAIGPSESYQIEQRIDIGKGAVRMVRWSPDGKRIAVAMGELAKIIQVDGSKEVILLHGHTGSVMRVSWSPDGKRLATASADSTIRIWNAHGKNPGRILAGHADSDIETLEWHPNGAQVMTTAADRARVWDVDKGLQPVFLEHGPEIQQGRFSPDGKRLMIVDSGGTANVWNVDGSGQAFELNQSRKKVIDAQWSLSGTTIITVSKADPDEPQPTLQAVRGPRRATLRGQTDPRDVMTAPPPGDSTQTVLQQWNADGTGKPSVIAKFDDEILGISMSPDGRRAAIVRNLAPCRVVDLQNAGQLLNIEIPCNKGEPPLWSPDGKQLASLLTDGRVQISNADGSGKPFFLEGNTSHIESGAWTIDGRQFAVATTENVVYAWSLDAPRTPRKVIENIPNIGRLEWSPDGTRIAWGSDNKTLRIVKVDNPDKPLLFDAAGADILHWSPDGQRFLAPSNIEAVRVWDAQGRGDPLVLAEPNALVTRAFWSPDGKRIVTIPEDRTARIWLVDIPLLQEALRNSSTNCLTPEQRESLLGENAEAARKGYETCEKSYGRNP